MHGMTRNLMAKPIIFYFKGDRTVRTLLFIQETTTLSLSYHFPRASLPAEDTQLW